MTWQDEERHGDFRWVLKCPFYLPYLAELNETFPDANIVWMHRDPVECIASACSLYESMMDMTCNTWTIDRIALGRAVLNYSELQLQKAEEAIKKNSNRLQITHVRYEALVEDPKRVVRRLSRKVTYNATEIHRKFKSALKSLGGTNLYERI